MESPYTVGSGEVRSGTVMSGKAGGVRYGLLSSVKVRYDPALLVTVRQVMAGVFG